MNDKNDKIITDERVAKYDMFKNILNLTSQRIVELNEFAAILILALVHTVLHVLFAAVCSSVFESLVD